LFEAINSYRGNEMKTLNFVLVVVLAILQVSCALTTPIGCTPIVKTSGTGFEIAGVSFPWSATQNIQIGRATVTPTQLQVLSESATRMEQYRLIQCGELSTLQALKPQPVGRIVDIVADMAKANLALQSLYTTIPNTVDPTKTIEKIENQSKTLTPPPLPPKSEAPPTDDRYRVMLDEKLEPIRTQLNGIDGALSSLPRTLSKISHAERSVEIVVSGFRQGSTNLSTTMKAHLLAELTSTIETSSSRMPVLVDVIGYADTTGDSTKNIALGLNRAKSVASFVTQSQMPANGKLRLVASAGAMEIAPFGRQVRVLLSFPSKQA
jgi:outer membrane protein OmpA-like peptidoglycan-associated protein